jgi:hypothetical protein
MVLSINLSDNSKEVLLKPNTSSEVFDIRTKWEIPTLICSGPVGGHIDFTESVKIAMNNKG